MKLLVITRVLAGLATVQSRFREIAKLGIDLTVVSPPCWAGGDQELRRLRPDGYEFLLHKCWFSGTSSVFLGNHLHFYPSISRVIGRDEWDLVHIDDEAFNLATYHALRACCRHHVPAIFTTFQNIDKNYPPPFNLFERFVFENASGAITLNAESLDILRHRGFGKEAVYIPTLGVDPGVFYKQQSRTLRENFAPDGSFIVGFVGRFHASKGLDTLVKGFALLPENSVLVLVGGGPYQGALEDLISWLGLTKRVRWVSWVDSDRVAEYMNTLDVLVLPSRTCRNWKEQFGRVLVEAMSCETCVVGSDSGDIPNVIGDAGSVFHEGDERELAAHLRRLMDDPVLRNNLSRRGRQRVLDRFTYEKIARDSVDFYRRICSDVSELSPLAV